jgi:hypothetical protein
MAKHHQFARNDVFPSWWPNAIAEQVGVLVENFELRKATDTTIEVPAAASDDLVVVGIDGKWRFRSTTVSRAHPGGASGVYPIFVVAAENVIVGTPLPFTDNTNYAFDLRIEAPGGTPAIVPGTVDFFRKVGEAVWDGTKITRVRQLVGQVSTRPVDAAARRADETPIRATAFAGQTADVASLVDSNGNVLLQVGPTGSLRADRPVGQDLILASRQFGDAFARVELKHGSIAFGPGSTAPDVTVDRTGVGLLRVQGGLEIDGTLDHDGANVGLFGVAPVGRRTGWGSFTHSDGTAAVARRTLASNYTMDQMLDVVRTIVEDLKTLGPFGT